MNTLKLLVLACIALFIVSCKASQPTAVTSGNIMLSEVPQVLMATQNKFTEFANQGSNDPVKAMQLTAAWVTTLPTVASAELFDDSYLTITLKSGLQTTFIYDELDSAGHSVYRGGGGSGSGSGDPLSDPKLVSTTPPSKNAILNKKVLIYAAAYSQFYSGPDMQKIVNKLQNAGLDLEVTLLKDAQCTYQIIDQFKDYGLVIIDTHGVPDGFLLGNTFQFAFDDTTEALLKIKANAALGAGGYDRLTSGQIGFVATNSIYPLNPNWKAATKHAPMYNIWVSTKYLSTLPDLGKTVVFGNMCYSGWQVTTPGKSPAVGTTFISKNPLSYYSYAFDDKKSTKVSNNFAIEMEDTLTTSFVVDGDSTAIAQLGNGVTRLYDKYIKPNPSGKLYCNQNGPLDYSYQKCVTFTDARDGEEYCSVKIGTQTWMSQNLRFNAPGSRCLNDDASKCAIYGRYYDWTSLMQGSPASTTNPSGVRGICPAGWHVPSLLEYTQLVNFLGGTTLAGGKMKAISPLWDTATSGENFGATNSSGFSALPSGFLYDGGAVNGKSWQGDGITTGFFTTDEETIRETNDAGEQILLYISSQNVSFGSNFKTNGRPCRCLKD